MPFHKKPSELPLEEWQRQLRVQFARDHADTFIVEYLDGEHPVFADYLVRNNQNGNAYKVAFRSQDYENNFCECLDFKTNMLGTCKHIEAVAGSIRASRRLARHLTDQFTPEYSSLSVEYGERRRVKLWIGVRHKLRYGRLAKRYCDDTLHLLPEAVENIDTLLAEARSISPDFRCYPDVTEFLIRERAGRTRAALVKRGTKRNGFWDGLVKTTLYPYQRDGVRFAFLAGRSLVADDMGLGKTVQAIASAELFKRECGVNRVVIVCPTSLKYQWKSEIQRFTDSSVQVVEGPWAQRQRQYAEDCMYTIVSYDAVGADLGNIAKMDAGVVILDEAQRIKNWRTKTAQRVKRLAAPYAIVLTGTPIQNKLEELHSIVQFIDPFKLGPLYKFLAEHQMHPEGDTTGKVIGYRDLNGIQDLLSDVMVRRTRQDVLTQLPDRTDKQLFVPMTPQQQSIHDEYHDLVAKLVAKWNRMGFLDEVDRQRLLAALNSMRMVADSTFILDQRTRYDTKITELMCIVDAMVSAGDEKAVIFSQWERMTRLVAAELDRRDIEYAYLHGGVPSRQRKELLDSFRTRTACRVFLSTDAGGVGLNLQAASTVINLDVPWNPAVLEQRIGRVHRHGQRRNVNVINLVSRDSIEQSMLQVLSFKSSLFAGVLDSGDDQVFMEESKFKRLMRFVADVSESTVPEAHVMTDVEEERGIEADTRPVEVIGKVVQGGQASTDGTASHDQLGGEGAVSQFWSSVAPMFQSLTAILRDPDATGRFMASVVEQDDAGRHYMKLPIRDVHAVADGAQALAGLMASFLPPQTQHGLEPSMRPSDGENH